MFAKCSTASLALAGIAVQTALALPAEKRSEPGFKWGKCEFEELVQTNIKFECSNYTVPLDYLDDKSDEKLVLQATRVPAINGPSKGTIFFNFGGPGFEARKQLATMSDQLVIITEGKFDIVSWDPRGVANTRPFECYSTANRTDSYVKLGLVDVYDPEDKAQLARQWAAYENFGAACAASESAEMAELIGTGYLARDLMQLKDALEGEDALLNYWGISYGTMLGATTAAMYPDKIGRVMLDGNINIPQWYNGWDTIWWEDSDKALYDFFDRCVEAGPKFCQLARRNETAVELNDRFYELKYQLRQSPIAMGGNSILDASALVNSIRFALYGNTLWPVLSVLLDELYTPAEKRNNYLLLEAWQVILKNTDVPSMLSDESGIGVYCSDKKIRTDSFEEYYGVIQEMSDMSKAMGEVGAALNMPCATWQWHAKGAYESTWTEKIETKNPLLFVNARYDPVTPIYNAHNASEIFVGSAVLQHNGIGHGVTTHPSLCTAKTIRAYFQNGKLPEKFAECEPDFGAFDTKKTWLDSYLPDLAWE